MTHSSRLQRPARTACRPSRPRWWALPAQTGWITRVVVDLTQANTDPSGPEFFDLLQFDVADATAPAVTATATPSVGWSNTPVSVAMSATDAAGSGLYELTYAANGATVIPLTHDSDGAASLVVGNEGTTTVSYGAVDCQGNTASGATVVSVDLTPPVVTFTGNAGSYPANGEVAITCAATDAMSGVASDDCAGAIGPAWSLGVGPHTLTATATDLAGNSVTTSTTFVVVTVDSAALCDLTTQLSANQGVTHALCNMLRSTGGGPKGNAANVSTFRKLVAKQAGKAFTPEAAALLDALAAAL